MREAAALASNSSDALAVVHVLPKLHPSCPVDARATELVRAQVDRVELGRPFELFAETGSAYAEILKRAEAWRADTIVVGSHGHSRLIHILGGVAERVVRHAHCSVLVARTSASKHWVLAATDLSAPSLLAVTAAGVEARRRRAQLKVVRAVGFLDLEASYLLELGSPVLQQSASDLDAEQRALAAAVARLGVDATCATVDRPAATAIIREAEAIGAELIVVGTRGKTGLVRLALGSVAEKVVRAAPCSVLAVRSSTSPPS
jgi:nucleotide-binding universal stress UspA family protein